MVTSEIQAIKTTNGFNEWLMRYSKIEIFGLTIVTYAYRHLSTKNNDKFKDGMIFMKTNEIWACKYMHGSNKIVHAVTCMVLYQIVISSYFLLKEQNELQKFHLVPMHREIQLSINIESLIQTYTKPIFGINKD